MSSQENKPPGTRGLLLIENSNYLNSVVQVKILFFIQLSVKLYF